MNGNGYSAMDKVLPSAFGKEQRTRLEALTAAKALRGGATVDGWLALADYIVSGTVADPVLPRNR